VTTRTHRSVVTLQHKPISIFVCGVQKGGTTSLDAHLREHPALSPPCRKEVHFFDDENRDWVNPDYPKLDTYFVRDDGERQRFDVTPIYCFWPPSMERLHAYNPAIKLIFLFRDPFERAWSQWQMEYARGDETLPFAVAIREGRHRLDALPLLAPERRIYSYIERGFYAEQVMRALSYFPRDQLLFMRSQDLYCDHIGTLKRIANFLGIDEFPNTGPKRENVRPEKFRYSAPTRDDKAHVAELLGENVRAFSALTGLDVSGWPTVSK
jgi:Sulfotransferase domain